MTGKGNRTRFDYTDEEVISKIREGLSATNPRVSEAVIAKNRNSGEYEGRYVDEYGAECRFSVNCGHIRSYFHTAMLWLKMDGGAYSYG